MTKTKTLMLGNAWNQTDAEEAIIAEYQCSVEDLEPYNVLVAFYSYESYSGDSYLLLQNRKTRELFVVTGGHCSCNGLEGMFEPSKTLASIELAKFSSRYPSAPFHAEYATEQSDVDALKVLITKLASKEKTK